MGIFQDYGKEKLWERFSGVCNGAGGVLLALALNHTIDCPIWAPLIVVFVPAIISLVMVIIDLIKSFIMTKDKLRK